MRYDAHIEMNSSLQEPIRQVQKKEIKRMGLFNQYQPSGFSLAEQLLSIRQYKQSGILLVVE